MIAAPHPAGCAAVDISPDGRYVATLSVPFGGGEESQLQEVAIWALPSATQQSRDAASGEAAQPRCIARAAMPTAATQLSIAFRTALAPGDAERIASGASVAFELATTGPAAVVFWSLVRSRLLTRPGVDDDPAAVVSGLATAAEAGLATTVHVAEDQGLAGMQGAQGHTSGGVWVDMWSLQGNACHPPGLSASAAPSTALSSTSRSKAKAVGAAAAAHRRQCSVTVFLPPVHTGNAVVTCATALSDGQVLLWGSGSGGTAAAAAVVAPAPRSPGGGRSSPGGKQAEKGHRSPARGAGSDDEDDAAAHSIAAEAMAAAREAAAIQAQAAATLVKSVQKTVKLGKPTFLGAGAAPPQANGGGSSDDTGINTLALSPCERYIVAGGEDGAVRVYDLGLRLQAWFEDLDAGPVTGIGFVPSASVIAAAARRQLNRRSSYGGGSQAPGAGYSPQPPPGSSTRGGGRRRSSLTMIERRIAGSDAADVGISGLANMVIATRHSLILTLQSSSFSSGDEAARRGVVVLEGPDAAVVGLVAYTAQTSGSGGGNRLAIATASGAVQVRVKVAELSFPVTIPTRFSYALSFSRRSACLAVVGCRFPPAAARKAAATDAA
jgi:hypothetical protein